MNQEVSHGSRLKNSSNNNNSLIIHSGNEGNNMNRYDMINRLYRLIGMCGTRLNQGAGVLSDDLLLLRAQDEHLSHCPELRMLTMS